MGLINNGLIEMLFFIFWGTYKISTHLSSHFLSRIYICNNNFIKNIQKNLLYTGTMHHIASHRLQESYFQVQKYILWNIFPSSYWCKYIGKGRKYKLKHESKNCWSTALTVFLNLDLKFNFLLKECMLLWDLCKACQESFWFEDHFCICRPKGNASLMINLPMV